METPIEKLKRMAAWNAAPTLTDAEVEKILANSALEDPDGLGPASPGWDPTYDFNAAAANAWLTKAARAAALVEVDPPGSGIVTSKVFDNCRAMARIYGVKRRMSVSVK